LGPQGAQGATGPQGGAGPTGAQGAAGSNGAQGATGPQGGAGPTGQQGATGTGGPTGQQGASGSQGAPGPLACPLQLCDGSATTPSYSFSADTNTGMYRVGADHIGFAVGGNYGFAMKNNGGFGDFYASANIIGFATMPSDERLKNNVKNLENGLDVIEQLRPVSYTWNENMGRGNDFGLIAQEVEKILPELIHETEMIQINDDEKYKTLSYERLVPFLIKSIQELNNKIKELEKK
jgi:hypothetical protein